MKLPPHMRSTFQKEQAGFTQHATDTLLTRTARCCSWPSLPGVAKAIRCHRTLTLTPVVGVYAIHYHIKDSSHLISKQLAAYSQKPNTEVARLLLGEMYTFLVASLIKKPAKAYKLFCGDGSDAWAGNYSTQICKS